MTLDERAELAQKIAQIKKQKLQLIPVDIEGTAQTNFFFYGKVPGNSNRALFLEWDLGNSIRRVGQNAFARYRKSGIYKVKLKVSDGVTSASDTISVRIVEKNQKNR